MAVMEMMSNEFEITFDDVLLLPRKATFPRSDEIEVVDVSTKVSKNIDLDIPIVSSHMPGVTEKDMAIAMSNLGGIGFIHQFQSAERQFELVKEAKKFGKVAVSLGSVGDENKDRIEKLLSVGADLICLSTYHSFSDKILSDIREIKSVFPKIELSAGPVVTAEAAVALAEAGVDSVNVGIGPGSHCTTRLVTGVGRPQLSAIKTCSDALEEYGVPVVAEGGVSKAADLAKALVFGASSVMIGGLFTGTDECPGSVVNRRGKKYKNTWGMCSDTSMSNRQVAIVESDNRGLKSLLNKWFDIGKVQSASSMFEEGVEGLVEYKGSVVTVVDELISGLRRSMWYQGARNIGELRKNAKVVLVSNNTLVENIPRI